MGVIEILSGRRYHFNSVITCTFNDIYNRRDEVVSSVELSDRETLGEVVKLLLLSASTVVEDIFGEKGSRKKYLKRIDKNKAKKLFSFLLIVFYWILKNNQRFYKDIKTKIIDNDVFIVYSILFEDKPATAMEIIQKLTELESPSTRIAWLIEKIYGIAIGVGEYELSKEKLQDMLLLGPYLSTTFETAFKELRDKYPMSDGHVNGYSTRSGGSSRPALEEKIIIKIQCPCGNKDIVNNFLQLGNDRKARSYFKCPMCKRHIQWDLLAQKIRARKSYFGVGWGKFVEHHVK